MTTYQYRTYRPSGAKSPHQNLPKKRGHKLIKFLFVAIISLALVYHFQPFWDRSQTASPKVAAEVKPRLSPSQIAAMSSQINSIVGNSGEMEVGVAIYDLNSNKNYHFGVSDPFIAASISKLLTASLFLHRVEGGQDSLNEIVGGGTSQYELSQMIEQSDNDAWQAFNDLLTHDGLLAYAKSLGITNYDPDNNTLSADDISLLLAKLYKNQLLNSQHTQLLLSYMQNANEDDFIVNNVPAGVKVYHKAGWLDDRAHDAAIIDNHKHPYVLVVFTKDDTGAYDADLGHQIFASITAATTKAFL
jgi:beta-lactamase class A